MHSKLIPYIIQNPFFDKSPANSVKPTLFPTSCIKLVPRRKGEAGVAVFAEADDFVLFQHTESLGGVAGVHRIRGIEEVAEFSAKMATGSA